ncbi:hypothetical protein HK101_001659 [Irineochytrium annulatum]|nr:hypothetical protein HK101_001659 [Irineochytrium annulatum]
MEDNVRRLLTRLRKQGTALRDQQIALREQQNALRELQTEMEELLLHALGPGNHATDCHDAYLHASRVGKDEDGSGLVDACVEAAISASSHHRASVLSINSSGFIDVVVHNPTKKVSHPAIRRASRAKSFAAVQSSQSIENRSFNSMMSEQSAAMTASAHAATSSSNKQRSLSLFSNSMRSGGNGRRISGGNTESEHGGKRLRSQSIISTRDKTSAMSFEDPRAASDRMLPSSPEPSGRSSALGRREIGSSYMNYESAAAVDGSDVDGSESDIENQTDTLATEALLHRGASKRSGEKSQVSIALQPPPDEEAGGTTSLASNGGSLGASDGSASMSNSMSGSSEDSRFQSFRPQQQPKAQPRFTEFRPLRQRLYETVSMQSPIFSEQSIGPTGLPTISGSRRGSSESSTFGTGRRKSEMIMPAASTPSTKSELIATTKPASGDPEPGGKASADVGGRSWDFFRGIYLEGFKTAYFNEFGEIFAGTVQRSFHIEQARADLSVDSAGFHPHSLFVVTGEIAMLCMYEVALTTNEKEFILDFIGMFPWLALVWWCGWGIQFPEALELLYILYCRNVGRILSDNPILCHFYKVIQRILHVGGAFMSIFIFMGLLACFLHLHACLLLFYGKISDHSAESWQPVLYVLQESPLAQYVWALFNRYATVFYSKESVIVFTCKTFSVSNTFPVTGYKASDTIEQALSIGAVFAGAVLYAGLVGTISSFSLGLDASGRKFKEKLDEVNEFMEEKQLPLDVRRKVRQYYTLKYHGKYFDKASIFSELNSSLRQEIAIHNLRGLLSRVPFLRREEKDGRDDAFVSRVAEVLKPEYFIEGDAVLTQGEVGNDMYFIERGSVNIVVNGKCVGALSDGAFFGEVALLDSSPRSATIRASAHTTLYRLAKDDFTLISNDFEDVRRKMQSVYEERLERIRKEKLEKLAMGR